MTRMIHDQRGLRFSFLNGSLKAREGLNNFHKDIFNQARGLLFEYLLLTRSKGCICNEHPPLSYLDS